MIEKLPDFVLPPRLRFEVINPAWVKQYERALGEPPFCVNYDPQDSSPWDSPCTGHAEVLVLYGGRSDIQGSTYCRACAGELVEQLQAAIDMHDAMDDPRRDTT